MTFGMMISCGLNWPTIINSQLRPYASVIQCILHFAISACSQFSKSRHTGTIRRAEEC